MLEKIIEVERLHFNELRKSGANPIFEQLKQEFLTRYTYNTLSLDERLTLSYEQVADLIKTKIILASYPEREQKEVLNHVKAFDYIDTLVNKKVELSEDIIKDIHEILVEGIFPGGSYRHVNVIIKKSIHQPPDHIKVYDRMKKYFFDLDLHRGSVFQKAALASASISKIYPFVEGNGRLARLLLNYILMYYGYLAIDYDLCDSREYIDAINAFKVERSLKELTELVQKQLLAQYDYCIEVLEGE